ncbi:MAG: HIT domain-containing protein [Thermodesulfobacteriota bacterium]
MKTLWTPWRMEHVTGRAPKVTGCLFEPPGDNSHDADHLLLFRDKLSVVLLNRFPYSNGHLLVAPRRHIADLSALTTDEAAALMILLGRCSDILDDCLNPDGCNIGLNLGSAAGAGIDDHLHFHVVPRWQEDHNFMTVVADIRTIPEHIDKTFARLLPEFQDVRKDIKPQPL